MLPVIFEIGPLKLYSYGLMAATGFLVASFLMASRAKTEGEDPEKALDLAFYIVLSALVGARIMYVLIEWPSYIHNPLKVFMVWEGGLVFYGGFIGSVVTSIWFVRKHNIEAWKMADIIAPALALGHMFGRLGCFGAGCCYGDVSDVAWSVIFTHPASLAPLNVPLHPTQLYMALNELVIFLILISVRRFRQFKGQIFLLWMILYAIGRFTIEIYRGDPRGFIGPFSTSQAVAIVALAVASALYAKLLAKSKHDEEAEG